jgi:hypothetical protein
MHKEKEMAEFRKYIYALALVALLAGLTAPASAQPAMVCSATSTVAPSLRVEGMTEITGDIIIDCTGGIPTPSGTVVKPVNINVSTNVALTSKITCAGCQNNNFSEALLLVDEPNGTIWASGGGRNVLNCGNPAAPDSDPAKGWGICQIFGSGNPTNTYDGTPNGLPGGVVCGAGQLAVGTFGCGRPNVFQARQDILSAFPQQRISFLNVPIDPPGSVALGNPTGALNCQQDGTCHRFFRITNIRVDAAQLGGASGSLVSGQPVFADLTVSDSTVLPLVNVNSLTIGRVNTTLGAPTAGNPSLTLIGCKDTNQDANSVTFAELVADAWKPRNISLELLNNTAATPLYNVNVGTVNATTPNGSIPAQYTAVNCRQNVPGVNFESESGFMNFAAGVAGVCTAGSGGGTPNVNPPNGIGTGTVPVNANDTQFNDGSGACSKTCIQQAGVATNGTRILLNVQNIFGAPGTVRLRVPGQVILKNRGNGNPSGVAILQSWVTSCAPTPAGDNTFCPNNAGFPTSGPLNDGYMTIGTVANNQVAGGLCTTSAGVGIAGSACSSGRVFYEVVYSDPGVQETITIPFRVDYTAATISLQPPVNPSPVAIVNGQMGYAPAYTLAAPQQFATTAALPAGAGGFPYPRFVIQSNGPFQLFSISGKCVCDLLFPYVTDAPILPGSSFDTGIAIANTSRDPGTVARAASLAGSFGFATSNASNGFVQGIGGFGTVVTNEQTGPVQFWYYSTQQTGGSPNFGNLGNGAQGNTQCTNVATPGQCNDLNGLLTLNTGTNVPAGGVLGTSVKNGSTAWGLLGVDAFTPAGSFTGYVIAQASFQYCHGTAFVSTNALAAVSGLTIPSLSYQALQLDNSRLDYRTTADGENLNH